MHPEPALNDATLLHGAPLAPHRATMIDHLEHWATATPSAVFLAERNARGDWTTIDYATMLERTISLAQGLLDAGATCERPVVIGSENGIAHALAIFGAQYAGVPAAPINPATLQAGGPVVRAVLTRLTPAVTIGHDIAAYETTPRDSVAAARVAIGPQTIAKILFTSGSTGDPKGVVTTQRMLCANQQSLIQVWPFLSAPQTLVDWLPWHHVYGGNKVLGLALASGGSLYVDAGKPTPDAFSTTVRNLREISPTAYFSVPRGYALLGAALASDAVLQHSLFERLRVFCNAGATMPERDTTDLRRRAHDYGRDVPVVSCWGATETAPMATAPADLAATYETIGGAVPGVTIKLAPLDGRYELRVKGPSVTPGYWRDPARTSEAFDAEGFFRSGDAGSLDGAHGLRFIGRIGENFKLATATWVDVAAVRNTFLEAAGPLVEDVVISGENRDVIGALVFLDERVAVTLSVRDIRARLTAALSATRGVPSATITRALIATGPADPSTERTAKGTLNRHAVLLRRAAAVERLHAAEPDSAVLHL